MVSDISFAIVRRARWLVVPTSDFVSEFTVVSSEFRRFESWASTTDTEVCFQLGDTMILAHRKYWVSDDELCFAQLREVVGEGHFWIEQ